MLFLLRKIRRKLMVKNKFTPYLLYAIGEIFLLVIGILIAVSLNTWNEDRKRARAQVSAVKEIQKDLAMDLVKSEELMDFFGHIELLRKKWIPGDLDRKYLVDSAHYMHLHGAMHMKIHNKAIKNLSISVKRQPTNKESSRLHIPIFSSMF